MTACSVCGAAIGGSDVLYTPTGAVICTSCFAKADVSASQALSAPWRGFAAGGAVAGALPFFIHVSTSSSVTVNGQVTSMVYRDWIAVACGVVAALLAVATLWSARRETLRRAVALAAGAGVLVLGAYQVARGFGVFETAGADSSSSVSFTSHPAEPDLAPKPETAPVPAKPATPPTPETCADSDACFQLGLQLDDKDPAGATAAYARACEKGGPGGCVNAAINYKSAAPPDLVKALAMVQHGCDLGDVANCSMVGFAYKNGQGTAQDLGKAKQLFEGACAKDYMLGCANLAVMYERGQGVRAHPKQALELYAKACEHDSTVDIAFACETAGTMLHDGKAVKKDAERSKTYLAKARELDAKACSDGNSHACESAKRLGN